MVEEFNREPAMHQLHDTIGVVDPLLEQVFRALLTHTERSAAGRLYIDGLLMVFSVSLLERHSTLGARGSSASCSGAQRARRCWQGGSSGASRTTCRRTCTKTSA